MRRSLRFLLVAALLSGCNPVGPPETEKDPVSAKKIEAAKKSLVGRWRMTVGESWQYVEFTDGGTYRLSQHHDGAGGREGKHMTGTYTLLDDKTVEVRLEGGEPERYAFRVTGNELNFDGHTWKRQ
jgi:hypothetical protein